MQDDGALLAGGEIHRLAEGLEHGLHRRPGDADDVAAIDGEGAEPEEPQPEPKAAGARVALDEVVLGEAHQVAERGRFREARRRARPAPATGRGRSRAR